MALNTIYKPITSKIVFPNLPSPNSVFDSHSSVSSGPLNLLRLSKWHQIQKSASVPFSLTTHQSISKPRMYWIHSFLSISKPATLIQCTIISHLEYSDDSDLLPHFAVFILIPSTSLSMWRKKKKDVEAQTWLRCLSIDFPSNKITLSYDGLRGPMWSGPYLPFPSEWIATALYSVPQTYQDLSHHRSFASAKKCVMSLLN